MDELDSGDVFCHNNVVDKTPLNHSVVCSLPAEVYSVPAPDFLMLCKDLIPDFRRFNKPYPSDEETVELYKQEQKWEKYKNYLLESIMVDKQIRRQKDVLRLAGV